MYDKKKYRTYWRRISLKGCQDGQVETEDAKRCKTSNDKTEGRKDKKVELFRTIRRPRVIMNYVSNDTFNVEPQPKSLNE